MNGLVLPSLHLTAESQYGLDQWLLPFYTVHHLSDWGTAMSNPEVNSIPNHPRPLRLTLTVSPCSSATYVASPLGCSNKLVTRS